MSKKKMRDHITIHYDERADKPTLAVAGAHGGLTAGGQHVVAHVYAEWGMIPSLEQIPISPSGEAGPSKIIRRGDVNREVQASLVMTPEVAIGFGKWLIEKGMAAYELRSEAGPPDVRIVMEDDDA